MTKIGLLSDTHGYLEPRVFEHFKDCDEVWHAGDVGDVKIIDQLASFKPLKVVYGNIDGTEIRAVAPLHQKFIIEGLKIWMTHIGGYPGRYPKKIREDLERNSPDIFICGHSHILKVMRDKKYGGMWCLNPGAAGYYGFHKFRTMLRFELDAGKMKNMEVIELGQRSLKELETNN